MPRPADAEARERIVHAAGRLFYDRGVQAVGTAEIVAAAGCGKNVLYRHFPSKTDLVAAYLEQFAAARAAEVRDVLVGLEDDPAGSLVALTRHVADRTTHRRFRGCALRNYLREVPDHDDAAGRVALAALATWTERVDALASRLECPDPAAVAARVRLVHEGLYAATQDDRAEAGRVAVDLVADLVDA